MHNSALSRLPKTGEFDAGGKCGEGKQLLMPLTALGYSVSLLLRCGRYIRNIRIMAKAQITTPEGFKINIEGTPKEISAVVEDLKDKPKGAEPTRRRERVKSGRVLL